MDTRPRDSARRAGDREPDWRPLFRAVGDELMAAFMWMSAVRTAGDVELQAYKHIHTRRYLYLDARARAFACAGTGNYRPIPLAAALESVMAPWWEDLGATAEEVVAAWAAIGRARE